MGSIEFAIGLVGFYWVSYGFVIGFSRFYFV